MTKTIQNIKLIKGYVEKKQPPLQASRQEAILHSDQGVHYPAFLKEVRKLDNTQSISRKGNCWDNASIESFSSKIQASL